MFIFIFKHITDVAILLKFERPSAAKDVHIGEKE